MRDDFQREYEVAQREQYLSLIKPTAKFLSATAISGMMLAGAVNLIADSSDVNEKTETGSRQITSSLENTLN